MIFAIIALLVVNLGQGVNHSLTVNRMNKEKEMAVKEVEDKYIGLIARIEERNKDVVDIYKKREDNLVALNEEQKKILEDMGREEVIKEKPKLVEPKLNESFRGIINEITKESNRGGSN